uniref:Putative secreted protein n=1 Tax=Anopheles darlingi TaxID=43151 RepID=A0A2M4DB82_ANODA
MKHGAWFQWFQSIFNVHFLILQTAYPRTIASHAFAPVSRPTFPRPLVQFQSHPQQLPTFHPCVHNSQAR